MSCHYATQRASLSYCKSTDERRRQAEWAQQRPQSPIGMQITQRVGIAERADHHAENQEKRGCAAIARYKYLGGGARVDALGGGIVQMQVELEGASWTASIEAWIERGVAHDADMLCPRHRIGADGAEHGNGATRLCLILTIIAVAAAVATVMAWRRRRRRRQASGRA